eukprot:9475274-Pyramimonas_sp.AAC.1
MARRARRPCLVHLARDVEPALAQPVSLGILSASRYLGPSDAIGGRRWRREGAGRGQKVEGEDTGGDVKRWDVGVPPALWARGGWERTHSSVQDGPRWLQEGPRERKVASKMARDSGRRVKIASDTRPRGLKTAPRRFQMPSEASKDHTKRPKLFKT